MTQVTIPFTTFRVLEKEIQSVRLAALEEAFRLAQVRSPQASAITRADLDLALKNIAATASLPAPSDLPTGHISHEDYAWLDQRLEPLRSQVIELAIANAGRQQATLSGESMTADLIREALDCIWKNPTQRSAALFGS